MLIFPLALNTLYFCSLQRNIKKRCCCCQRDGGGDGAQDGFIWGIEGFFVTLQRLWEKWTSHCRFTHLMDFSEWIMERIFGTRRC